jgi:hypothetical protein
MVMSMFRHGGELDQENFLCGEDVALKAIIHLMLVEVKRLMWLRSTPMSRSWLISEWEWMDRQNGFWESVYFVLMSC